MVAAVELASVNKKSKFIEANLPSGFTGFGPFRAAAVQLIMLQQEMIKIKAY